MFSSGCSETEILESVLNLHLYLSSILFVCLFVLLELLLANVVVYMWHLLRSGLLYLKLCYFTCLCMPWNHL